MSASRGQVPEVPRIAALDVLRVAGIVAVISLLHSRGYVVDELRGLYSGWWWKVALPVILGTVSAVSGHVLAVAYPVLGDRARLRRFLTRRVARLWPLYSVACLVFWLVWFRGESAAWVVAQFACVGFLLGGVLPPSISTIWYVQMSLLFSVAYAVTALRPERWRVGSSILLLALGAVWSLVLGVGDERLMLYAPAFAFGAFVGLRPAWSRPGMSVVLGWTAAAVALGLGIVLIPLEGGGWADVALRAAFACAIYVPFLAVAGLIARVLPRGAVSAAACGSYAAFLFHRPIMSAMKVVWTPVDPVLSTAYFIVAAPVLAFGFGWVVQRGYDLVRGTAEARLRGAA